MIYLEILEGNEIGLIHYQPFDEVRGLKKTEEELLQKGTLVESIPEPEEVEGKEAILKFDGTSLYYEYVVLPLTADEKIKQLESQSETQSQAIAELTMMIAAPM